MDTEDYIILDNISADTIEPDDQLIIEGDLVRVLTVDSDRDDIDEVFITVENFTGEDDSFSLFADDYYVVWSI